MGGILKRHCYYITRVIPTYVNGCYLQSNIDDSIGIFDKLSDFDKTVLKHHYYGLSYRHYKKYLRDNENYNRRYLKKMLYTIRCILAWKVLNKGNEPSMILEELLYQEEIIDDKLTELIIKIRDSYTSLDITVSKEEIKEVYSWIIKSLDIMKNDKSKNSIKRDIGMYNRRFQEILWKIRIPRQTIF